MKKTRIFIAAACLVLAVGGTAATKRSSAFTTVWYISNGLCVSEPFTPTDCSTTVTANPCTDGTNNLYEFQQSSTQCKDPLYLQ